MGLVGQLVAAVAVAAEADADHDDDGQILAVVPLAACWTAGALPLESQ